MCEIFAGQDPARYASETRSIRLNGHSTSIRLEAAFWAVLEQIATRQNFTLPQFLSALHDEVLERHGEVRNFASLLRCACLVHAQDQRAGRAAVAAGAMAAE